MVGPWILFAPLEAKKGRDMGDIEYLATQQKNGNITRLEGAINTLASKLSHTVAGGKDGYILVAKIIPSGFTAVGLTSVRNTSNTTSNHTEAKISANTVEIDRVTVGFATGVRGSSYPNDGAQEGAGVGGAGYGSMTDGKFSAAIGMKVTTGQVIEIENTLDNGNCRAQLVILEVNTGATPQLPSI